MRYRVGSEEVGSFHRDDYPSPPPSYDVSHRYGTLAPPDYHDAFQDVLLDSGENNNNTETTGEMKTIPSCPYNHTVQMEVLLP